MPCLIMNDMAKALSRKVTIYIDGKEVESTLKSLKGELSKLKREQASATIGSEDYIEKSLKIREITSVIEDQEKAVRSLGDEWKNMRSKFAEVSKIKRRYGGYRL